MRKLLPALILLALSGLMLQSAAAEIKVIEADSVYVLGDKDSKLDARRIATQEAKRKALELAGTFVASLTEVKEYRLSKDEVTAYTAGIIETEIIADEARGTVARPEHYIKARCRIDTDILLQEIGRYRENQELRAQLEASTKEQAALRKERDELLRRLETEKDKTRAAETQSKIDTILARQEAIDDTNRAWARLSPRVDLYSGGELAQEVTLGDLEDTAIMLEKAVEVIPDNQQTRILLATVYERRNDRAGAERQLQAALSRDPNNPLLRMRLGVLYREQGKYPEALREFRFIESKRPNQPHMLFQTGLTHKSGGNCRLATAYMKRFLRFTQRNDKPDIRRMKPGARAVLEECGGHPPAKRTPRRQPHQDR